MAERNVPTLVLVLHERLHEGVHPLKATVLPYSEAHFRTASSHLFQHQSLKNTIERDSTAVLNIRHVEWDPMATDPLKSTGMKESNQVLVRGS